MQNIIHISGSESQMSSVRTKISMIGNSFRENIAIDVIHIAMLDANISFNRFDNIEVSTIS